MSRLGRDFGSVAAVGAAALAVAAIFPYEILSFRVAPPVVSRASVSFVSLSARSEEEVVRAVKENWRKDSGAAHLYADLVFSELPENPGSPVLSVGSRGAPPPLPVVESGLGPYLPSERAPEPVALPIEPVQRQQPAFSREELLRIQ